MTPREYNFNKQYQGDTFIGVQIKMTKTVSGVTTPLDLTNAFIEMNFRTSKSAPVAKTFTSNNGITILDAANGIIFIDRFNVTLDPAKYMYDFKVTFPDGLIRTYLTGVFEVTQNLN